MIKLFREWVSTTTGGYDVNDVQYNNKLSNIVKEVGNYIIKCLEKGTANLDFLNKTIHFENESEAQLYYITINDKNHLQVIDSAAGP
jgi:uncharacterized FlaG/YvyC family protein